MSQLKKIAHNTIIQVIGKAVTLSIGLATLGLITRYLGQEGFGMYTTVYSFLAVCAILVDLGLQMTVTQMISDPRHNEAKILNNALALRLTASTALLAGAPLIGLLMPYPPAIKAGIAIAAIGFVFSSVNSTLASYFQKHLITHQQVIAEVIGRLVMLGATAIVVLVDGGLHGLIGATALEVGIITTALVMFIRPHLPLTLAWDWPVWKAIMQKTWPIAITIALNLIYFKGDIVIMSLLRTQTEVGLYGAPYRVLELLINLVYIFLGLLLPVLTVALTMGNKPNAQRIIRLGTDILLAIAIPLFVGGLIVGKPLMVLMAGPDFAASGALLKVLLIATGMIFIASLCGYVIVAANQQRRMIKFYALNAAIAIIGYTLAIKAYGYWGAAWMTVVTESCMLLSAAYVMRKTTGLTLQVTILKPILAASGAMALSLFLINGFLPVLLTILCGMAVYAFVLYSTGGISSATIRHIFSLSS